MRESVSAGIWLCPHCAKCSLRVNMTSAQNGWEVYRAGVECRPHSRQANTSLLSYSLRPVLIIFGSCCVFPNHLIMSVCNWVEQFAWSHSSTELLLKYVPENDNQSPKVDAFWYLLTNHDELEQLNLVNYSWMAFLLRLCGKECQPKIDLRSVSCLGYHRLNGKYDSHFNMEDSYSYALSLALI